MDLAEVLSLWWVYPAALCIAALAISTGISGALFFVPFFLLVVGVSPAQAIGGGLMTMIFGTGSGAFSYVRQGVVDFTIVKSLLLVTVPFAMAGAVLALLSDPDALRVLFGVMLFALAAFLLWSNIRRAREDNVRPVPVEMLPSFHPNDTVILARDGREYRYIRPGRTVSQALAAVGALAQGVHGRGPPRGHHDAASAPRPVAPARRRRHVRHDADGHGILRGGHPRNRRRAPLARRHLVMPRRPNRRPVRRPPPSKALPQPLPACPRDGLRMRRRAGNSATGRGVMGVIKNCIEKAGNFSYNPLILCLEV